MGERLSSQFWYNHEKGAVLSNLIRGRYIITPNSFLHIVTDEYRKAAGKGAPAVLYAMGFEDGKNIGKALADQFGLGDITKFNKALSSFSRLALALFNFILDFFKWGYVTEFDANLEEKRIEIKILDHALSRYQKGKDESYCDWVRGWVAGIITIILDEEMACIEKKCRTCGDPYCELIIGRKEEILFENHT